VGIGRQGCEPIGGRLPRFGMSKVNRRVRWNTYTPEGRMSLLLEPRSSVEERAAADTTEYQPFGNVETRNDLQARLEIPTLIRALRLPIGVDILEIGCGRGVALPVLSERLMPTSLVGLDIDAALVGVAQQAVLAAGIDARAVEGDARRMPFESESVDLVVDFGTCYHVSGGRSGSLAALREVERVLRPGGLFVHETRVAQMLAHPVRSRGRKLPWELVPGLEPLRSAVLWSVRRKRFS
jgi:SAM-dependent methyltransferase